MPRQYRKEGAFSSKSKVSKPDRFTPLLADIQHELGNSWTFYEECIDGILDAAANQQDTTAWLEQMKQLIDGSNKVAFSHEGILFLLRDMGIRISEQQSWGEGESFGKYPSPPLSLPEHSTEPTSPYVDNMAPSPVRPYNAMASQLLHRPLAPRASTPHLWQQSANPLDPKQRVLPFDFSAPIQPALTLPKDLRAFHCPPEQIIMTEGYVPPPPNPLIPQPKFTNPILFTDSAFREDVMEHFGHTIQAKASSGKSNTRQPRSSTIGFYTHTRQTIPYRASDDDLLVWRKGQERSHGDQAGEGEALPAGWAMSDTWPQWNSRLDLEL